MLKIGEIAALTGLSVKALRHYDERGVLVPADVDERSGYRRYAGDQVRQAVVIRALRDADVPLPAVSAALRSGDVEQTLEAHRRDVIEQREREDRAFEAASNALRALASPVAVTERRMPAQPYVGRVIVVPLDDVDAPSDEDANEVFADLYGRVAAAGLGPVGQFWTTLREGERGSVELVCCWPTLAPVPADVIGPEAFAAELPERTELVASWPHSAEELPEGMLHPAVVGLFEAVAERDLNLDGGEVRQSIVGGEDGGGHEDGVAVEVAVTVR